MNSSSERDGLVVEDVVRLHEHAELARRAGLLVEHVEVLDDLRLLVDPLDGVGLQHELVLDAMPADEDHDAGDREPDRGLAGQRRRATRRAGPSGPSRKSLALRRRLVLADAEDRERADDAVDADRGDTDGEQQAELPDHRHLGEAQRGEGEDRVEGDDEQRGPEVAGRLLDRVLGPVDDDLFLDARVHLDRVVDADAEHHGQAARS